MSDQTPVEEVTETPETPPSSETDQPSESAEPTESVEELKERLAAEEKARLAAEEEAKRWKGRVKEENPPKKKSEGVTEDDIDWKILNADRISNVKEAYDKNLQELQDHGANLSNSLRETALRLAESETGITKKAPDESLPAPSVDRTGGSEPKMSEYDRAIGIKPETIKEYADYVEGR